MRRSYKILITGVVILIAGFSIQWILPRLLIEDENFLTAVRAYEHGKLKSFDDYMNSPLKEYYAIILIMGMGMVMPYAGGVVLALGTAVFFLDRRKKAELTPKPKQVDPRKGIACFGIVFFIISAFGIWDLLINIQDPKEVVFQNQILEMGLDIIIIGIAAVAGTLLLKLKKLGVILGFIALGLNSLDAVIVSFPTPQIAIIVPFMSAFVMFLLYKNWKALKLSQDIKN